MSGSDYHVPVLLDETLELLAASRGGVYVDGTLGGGGHFRAVAEALPESGTAVGIDRDQEALFNAAGQDWGGVKARLIFERSRFSEFDSVLRKYNIDRVAGLFVDLGVSSRQIDKPERGFMYMGDAPLDMRMDRDGGMTAARLLEESGEDELAAILEEYGEIRNAKRMAAAVKRYMADSAMKTSADLRACIAREYGERVKIQVLAKLFQALRIAVNGELGELRAFLDKSVKYLAPGGRVAVISYHSLEDRTVKEFFRSAEEPCVCPPRQPVCTCNKPVTLRRVNRKAVAASAEEAARNPRSRSARLRAAERTEA